MSHSRDNIERTFRCGGGWLRNFLMMLVLTAVAATGYPGAAFGKGGDRLTGFPAIDVRSGEQHAKAMAVDRDGNTVIVGTAGSGGTDYFVAKFKADGSGLAWQPKSYGGTGTDIATAVAVDGAGDIVVTGYTWSGSHYDVHTIKYNGATGEPIWQHTWDNAAVHGDDYAVSLALDDAGNIYIAGYSANGTKEYDFLVLKYPAGGSTSPWTDLSDDLAYPNNNNYLTAITAGTDGFAVTGHSSKGGPDFDMVTRKYSFDGTMVREWRYSSPGGRDDRGVAVKMDQAGNVAVTGYATNASNNKDIYSAKYNPGSSAPIWEKTYNNGGGSSEDQPQALWVDRLGDVYVTGTTVTLAGNTDIFTVRYGGTTGNQVWQNTFDAGNGAADVPVGIIVDDATDGGVFVSGYTTVASTDDFVTLKYRKDTGAVLWATTWNNVFNLNDRPVGIGIDLSTSNLVVAGWTGGGATENDFIVLKYDFGPLNAPTKLVASAVSNTAISLTWADNSPNEEKFVVQRKLGETGTWSSFEVPSSSPPTSAESVTWTDPEVLQTNKYYYYRVLACIGAGEGNCSHPSNEARALTKVVSYATPAWSYVYDGADHREDIPSAITFDTDNNPVVTGHSDLTEEGLEPGENTHTFDYLTLKLDRANGSVKWKARYDSGDGGTDMAAGLALDGSGNLIVTGTAYLPSGGDKSDELYTRKVRTSTVTGPTIEPDFMWEDQFGTASGIDFATAITMVKDGSNNSVVLGYGQNAKNPPDYDIFIIKLDSNGVRSWEPVVYDSGRGDEPAGLAVDAAGNIFITGYSYDRGDNPEGTYDWFTAKYSGATGALIWKDTFNISNDVYGRTTGNDQALGIDVDAAGNAYVTGYATNADGRSVFYTVKYDGAATLVGRRIWQKAFNNSTAQASFDAEGIAVKVDPIDGAVVVAGTAYVSDTDSDFHLIRYNPADGSLTEGGAKPFWERNFDSPGTYEYATAMTMDSSGYIYVTGNTRSGPDTDPLANASSNIVSFIYDFEGTFRGAMRYDGTGRKDEATAITANNAGEAFVAGLMTNAAGNPDYAVLKQSNNGLLVPAPVTVTSQADSSKIDLTWQHNNPGASFIIKRTIGPVTQFCTWTSVANPVAGTTSYTDTSLSANTNYCYSISASLDTDPSREVIRCVTTRVETPVLAPLTVGPDPLVPTITLEWNNVTNSTGYKIERRIGSGAWQDLLVKGAGIITHTDTGLSQGTTYSYRVTALGATGNSMASNERSVTTRPSAPTLNAPTNVTNCQLNLSWSTVTGGSTFTVYAKPAGGSYAPLSMCTDLYAVWGCTVTDLTPLVQYTFQVKASNAAGESAGSNEQSATPSMAAPTLNAATNVTNESMYFTWTTVTGATTYTLEMKDGAGVYGGVSGCDNTPNAFCTVTGLLAGHTYTFRLRGNNSCGSSAWSGERSSVAALATPTLNTPTGATDTTMNLSWASVYGATTYYVEGKVLNGTYAPVTGCSGVAGTSCTATGLTPARTYYFRLKAGNAVVGGDSAWSSEKTVKTLLPTPVLSGASGGANQIVLTWGAVPEATSYKVEQASCSSSASDPGLCTGADPNYAAWTTLTSAATGTGYTASGLTAGTDYRYRITAQISTTYTSAVSSVRHAWTNMIKPTVTVTPASETSLTLAWDTQSGETGYKIEQGPSSTGPWTVRAPSLAINSTGYTDSNLAQQTEYCYIVTAFSTAELHPPDAPSNPVCRTTPLPAPVLNPPSDIASTQMKISWGHLNSNTGYEVERCPSSTPQTPTGRTVGTPCTTLPKVPTDTEFVVDTGLTAGNTYRYRVRATYGTSDYTGWSTEQWATTVPAKPVLNTPSSYSATQLNVGWTDVTGDNGYKLYWKVRSGADCTAGDWSATPIVMAANATSYIHSGLVSGTYYCYYLVASGAPGPPITPDSPASDVKTQMTYPAAPVQNDITNISGTSLTVNWNDVTGETGYNIRRKLGATGAYYQINTVGANVTSYTDSGLLTGTPYYYEINATSSVGYMGASNEKSATTTPAVPVATGTVISDDRVDICWPLVYGATYYKIDRKTEAEGTYGQIASPAVAYGTSYCGEATPTVGCPNLTINTYCYQDTGLTQNTTYYYHVHSGNGTDSPESIERSLTTLNIASRNLTATALNGGLTIMLEWTPMTCSPVPCDAPDYFEIQRQVRDGMWMPLKIVEGTKTSYVDNVAIDPNCKYRYRIRSLKGALQSPFAEAEVFAKPYLPGTNVCR